MSTIAFFLPSLDHPRFVKRINSAEKLFDKVVIFSFIRKTHQYGGNNQNVETINLGELEDGNYLSRPLSFIRAYSKVKQYTNRYADTFDHVYAFNVESAYLAKMTVGWENLVYEVGDLLATKFSPSARTIYAYIEKKIYQSARKVVFTSFAFTKYVEQEYGISINNKTVIIENKLSKEVLNFPPKKHRKAGGDGKISVGLIGILRFKPIKQLLDYVQTHPEKITLHVWGVGPYADTIEEAASHYDNIYFYGKFSSPGDLPLMYSKIDLSFVVYDTSIPNIRVALPNKLYESQYFEIPILVAENTELWRLVSSSNTGFSVDDQRENSIAEFFDDLDYQEISNLKENMASMAKNQFMNTEKDFETIFQD